MNHSKLVNKVSNCNNITDILTPSREYRIELQVNSYKNSDVYIQAIENGDVSTMNCLMEQFVKNGGNYSDLATKALADVVKYDHFDLVKFLVSKGAVIKTMIIHQSPVVTSVANNNIKIAKYLIKHGCKKNNSYLLQNSTINSNDDIVKSVLKHCNYDYNQNCLLKFCAKFGYMDKVKYLVNNVADIRPAIKASISGNSIEVLEYLLNLCLERNLSIPIKFITGEITDANRLLILFAAENQYNLFDPSIVKTLTYSKSARNTSC